MSAARPKVVYHCWPCRGWRTPHRRIMSALRESGLADVAEEIIVSVAGAGAEVPIPGLRRACTVTAEHPRSEVPSIRRVHATALASAADTPILYLHTKGASCDAEPGIGRAFDWLDMMVHFTVDRWPDALRALGGEVSAVGCNLSSECGWHFSGNVWWGLAGALARLTPPALDADRMDAEFWIGGVGREHMASLHDSGVDHYSYSYPRRMYRDRVAS